MEQDSEQEKEKESEEEEEEEEEERVRIVPPTPETTGNDQKRTLSLFSPKSATTKTKQDVQCAQPYMTSREGMGVLFSKRNIWGSGFSRKYLSPYFSNCC